MAMFSILLVAVVKLSDDALPRCPKCQTGKRSLRMEENCQALTDIFSRFGNVIRKNPT